MDNEKNEMIIKKHKIHVLFKFHDREKKRYFGMRILTVYYAPASSIEQHIELQLQALEEQPRKSLHVALAKASMGQIQSKF